MTFVKQQTKILITLSGQFLSGIKRKVIRPWVQASWKVYIRLLIKPGCLTWCRVFEKKGEKLYSEVFLYTMDEENKKRCENFKPEPLTKDEKKFCKRKKSFKTVFKEQNGYLEIKSIDNDFK